jgi:class 3 adenylate cyclase/tetratricopeptide (TPR) repeat protein
VDHHRDQKGQSDRRQATVIFADISGFTALSEVMDPEDMRDTMDACFHVLEEVVVKRGGIVDKYIGDCVMAVFGAPKALENASRQAVNAAIAMRNELVRFNQEHQLPSKLDCHIGVNTGLVISGDIGGSEKRDYTVMGPTVNLAARLEGKATNGEIFVGPATYRETRDDFEYRAIEPLNMKGIDEPVLAHDVVSRQEYVHDARAVDRTGIEASELVGRQVELGEIRAMMQRLRGGEGGVLTIEAENGMGKSRLIAEALGSGAAEGFTVLEGRSLATGDVLAFHPFQDLLTAWADVADQASDDEILAAIEVVVADVLGDSAAEVFPFLARMMGRDPGPRYAESLEGVEGEALERLIYQSMRAVLTTLAAARPLVVIFDDCHWADQSSVALLESLLAVAATHPVLFLLSYRPDHERTSDRLARFAHEHLTVRHRPMTLGPLSSDDAIDLVRGMLGTMEFPHELRDMIQSRAGGNPLYVEEVLRSLLDEGVLRRSRGHVVARGDLSTVEIHGSLEQILMARVDRLGDATKLVLQYASVIGRRFHRSVLESVINDPTIDLEKELSVLQDKHLLGRVTSHATANPRRRTLSLQEGYFFHNGLAQQALYESMLKKTRRLLHKRCAEAVETGFAARLYDFYGLLAYHYTRAELPEKAQSYLTKAGDEASASAASAEALEFFREAYRVYTQTHGDGGDNETKARLERNIAMALLRTGNLGESIQHFNAALELYGEYVPTNDRQLYLKAARDLPAVLFRLYSGSLGRATRGRDRDHELFDVMYNRCRAQNIVDAERSFFDTIAAIRHLTHLDSRDVDQAVGIIASAGSFFAFAGLSFGVSQRFLDLAARFVENAGEAEQFQYETMRFVLAWHRGDWADEALLDDSTLSAGLRKGLLWNADVYLGLRVERDIRRGEFAAAEAGIERLRELCDDWGYGFARSNQDAMSAVLLLERRELEAARVALQRYHDHRSEDTLHLLALAWRAKAETLDGDLETAEQTLADGADILRRGGIFAPLYEAAYTTSRLRLDVALAESENTSLGGRRVDRRVRKNLRRALQLSRKVARERVECLRLAGRLADANGSIKRARNYWRQACQEAEQLGARPEAARTWRDLGLALQRQGGTFQGEDGAVWLDRAAVEFSALGLKWELAHMNENTRRVA